MDERLCPCLFQIPTHYNPRPGESVGRPVEAEVMIEIQNSIKRQFGAFTTHGSGPDEGLFTGCWGGQSETSFRYEVAIPERRVPELRRLVIAIGRALGQKAMYLEVGPPSVEIIPIPDEPSVTENEWPESAESGDEEPEGEDPFKSEAG